MPTLPAHILAENKRLCESKTAIPVCERAVVSAESIQRVSDGAGKPISRERNGRTEHLAQIADADKIGLNGRGYSREIWQQQIEHFSPLLESGMLIGAVDHTGPLEGGSLKHAAIIWRELSMKPDGAVMGWYQITESAAGRDLSANKQAGMCLGFSSQGYGMGRPATEADREKFGIPPSESLTEQDPESGEEIPKYVIMSSFRLARMDTVDDPSFVRARDQRATEKFTPITAAEVANALKTSDASRKAVREGAGARGSASPDPVLTQFAKSKSGDVFSAEPPGSYVPSLEAHAYRVISSWTGPLFVKMRPQTDELYNFPGSISEQVVNEINAFWLPETQARYENLGMLHNRGVLMHSKPGMGKTASMHLAAEAVVNQGDVVFYVNRVSTLIEGLQAFREVEPTRKVVVCLEDADEYLGHQERDFLQLLDGEQSVNHVLFIASTNYLNRFPERLKRPGRFDKLIHVPPPPLEGRIAYLNKKIGAVEKPEEIARLAKATEGLSFGHLRELVLAIYALKEPAEEVLNRLRGRAGVATESAHSENVTARLSVSKEQSGVPVGAANTENDSMKTFAELKAAHPELAASIETSTHQAVEAAVAPVKEKCESLVSVVNDLLSKVKEIAGVEIPHREVLPAETAQQIESLKAELATEKAKTAAVEQAKQAAEALVAKATAEKAESDRQSKVTAAFEAAVKDNAYINGLRKAFAKPAADPKFGESDVAAFIKETVELFEAAGLKPERGPETGLTGVDVDPDELPTGEGAEGPVFAG